MMTAKADSTQVSALQVLQWQQEFSAQGLNSAAIQDKICKFNVLTTSSEVIEAQEALIKCHDQMQKLKEQLKEACPTQDANAETNYVLCILKCTSMVVPEELHSCDITTSHEKISRVKQAIQEFGRQTQELEERLKKEGRSCPEELSLYKSFCVKGQIECNLLLNSTPVTPMKSSENATAVLGVSDQNSTIYTPSTEKFLQELQELWDESVVGSIPDGTSRGSRARTILFSDDVIATEVHEQASTAPMCDTATSGIEEAVELLKTESHGAAPLKLAERQIEDSATSQVVLKSSEPQATIAVNAAPKSQMKTRIEVVCLAADPKKDRLVILGDSGDKNGPLSWWASQKLEYDEEKKVWVYETDFPFTRTFEGKFRRNGVWDKKVGNHQFVPGKSQLVTLEFPLSSAVLIAEAPKSVNLKLPEQQIENSEVPQLALKPSASQATTSINAAPQSQMKTRIEVVCLAADPKKDRLVILGDSGDKNGPLSWKVSQKLEYDEEKKVWAFETDFPFTRTFEGKFQLNEVWEKKIGNHQFIPGKTQSVTPIFTHS